MDFFHLSRRHPTLCRDRSVSDTATTEKFRVLSHAEAMRDLLSRRTPPEAHSCKATFWFVEGGEAVGLRRRELLKIGLFGAAALMLPAERSARTELALNDRIAASRLPRPFTVPFAVPPVLTPVLSGADTGVYSLTQRQASAEILPGLRTDVWGYNGLVPGPTIMVPPGRTTIVRQINALPPVHPTLRYKV